VSQQIALEDAVDWLIHRREFANYGQTPFSEPECGHELNYVAEKGLRKVLNAYVSESTFLYVFDPDHAMLAYPLRALQLIGAILMSAAPVELNEEQMGFLKAHARDNLGSLPVLLSEMKRLSLVN
jgi:hypothetical protein